MGSLKNAMTMKLKKSLIPPEIPQKALSLFEDDFLREVFRKGAEAITRVIALIESFPIDAQVERKLKIWVLNYLSRNAKNTLFEQRGPVHFSPFEQQRSNQNEYYRMNGGAITPFLLSFLKETYALPEKGYFLGAIKRGHFSFLIEAIFHNEPFYLISDILQKGLPHPFKPFIDQWTERDPEGIFGGEFELKHQTFYLIFAKRDLTDLMELFGSVCSGIGGVPDCAALYHALIDHDFLLQHLYTLSPLPLEPLFKRKNTVVNRLEYSRLNTAIAEQYLDFFGQYVKKEEDNPHLAAIVEIDQMPYRTLNRKFQDILQEVYLAYEELSFSLILSGSKTPPLQRALHAMAPSPPYKKTVLCTSGMSGYFHVFRSLKTFYGRKPKAAFLNTTYYEIVHKTLMGKALDLMCIPTIDLTIEAMLDPTSDWDILCMDLYPNFVSIDPVQNPPIEKILQAHLKDRRGPLTIILDITGTIVQDEILAHLVQTFEKDIETGWLHLIFISSLAKFYTGGLDKYGGGFVQTYSVALHLDFKDPLSEEAETFFSLIFHENGTWLKKYYATIQQNSDRMYHSLRPLQTKNSLFHLCTKDQNNPFIGLSFHCLASKIIHTPLTNHHLSCIAYFLQYFLLARSLPHDLSLTVRDSFGFPTTNMRQCGGMLRLTVGIENPSLLEELAAWLIQEEKTMQKELDHLPEALRDQTDYCFSIDPHFFMNWMEKMKLILIDYAKKPDLP
jgi:hypothetical protein